MRTWNIARLLVVVLACLVIAGYALFEARGILAGPSITVDSPKQGETFIEPIQRITGTTSRIIQITLNDRPIVVSKDGVFDELLVLMPGYNKTTIRASDRFGAKTQTVLENYFIPAWYDTASSTNNLMP